MTDFTIGLVREADEKKKFSINYWNIIPNEMQWTIGPETVFNYLIGRRETNSNSPERISSDSEGRKQT